MMKEKVIPQTLYHYTRLDNLQNIIRQGEISRWDRYLGMTAAMTQVPVPSYAEIRRIGKAR